MSAHLNRPIVATLIALALPTAHAALDRKSDV